MFANLKNKLFEEVKASPSKFQQFAQAAQAAVSSSSSNVSEPVNPSDGNFFSITEEDTPQNSPQKINKDAQVNSVIPPGPALSPLSIPNSLPTMNNGINRLQRTRRLSNSSMASDVSFRLPAYESPAVYHLQSDLEISGSEHEDSASTTHLDVISKEQLHDAYRRSLDRYQKYRSRYTDLAKKYRELERDCTKARTVLVDTQDKAIRRINELREQCSLEQQAKAHLEEALRMEMDDMQCKIKSYETKLKLKGDIPEKPEEETLIKLIEPNLINLTSESTPSENGEIPEDFNKILKDRNEQILKLELSLKNIKEELELLKKHDEENSIQLAEKKLEIYSELENKEKEINDLKNYRKKYNELESKLQNLEKENNLLKKQSSELIDVKEKLKNITASKQDFEAKVISHEHILKELKKSLKEKEENLELLRKSSEETIKSVSEEYDTKIKLLQIQNNEINSILEDSSKLEINMANIDTELNRTKTENQTLKENLMQLQAEFEKIKLAKDDCEKKIYYLQNELQTTKNQDKHNETDINNDLKQNLELTITESQNRIKELEQNLKSKQDEFISSKENFLTELKVLHSRIEELNAAKVNGEEQTRILINSLEEAVQNAEERLSRLQIEKLQYEERVQNEKVELKNQITNIISNIANMQQEMDEVRQSHSLLENEKQVLEEKIENMHKENLETQEGSQRWQSMVQKADNKLRQVEKKLQAVESENSQLAEKNCLLEENSNRLEKLINDSDNNIRKQHSYEEELNHLRSECQQYKDNAKKLEEKLLQALDENSNLLNTKEFIEHELHSKMNLSENNNKEHQNLLDLKNNLEKNKRQLEEENNSLVVQINELNMKYEKLNNENETVHKKIQSKKDKLEKLLSENKALQLSNTNILADLNLIKSLLSTDKDEDIESTVRKLKENFAQKENELKKLNEDYDFLKQEHSDIIRNFESVINENKDHYAKEISVFNQKIVAISEENNALRDQNDSFKKELDTLNNQNQARLSELEKLLKETKDHNQTLQQSVQNATDLEKKLQNYEQLKIENEYLNTLTNQLESDLRKQKEEKSKLDDEISQLKSKLQTQQCELYVLKSSNEKLNSEILEINNKLKTEREINEKNSENFKIAEDSTQRDLLVYQQKLIEAEKLCAETRHSYEQIVSENIHLKSQLELIQTSNRHEIDNLKQEIFQSQNSIKEFTINLQESKKIINQFQNVHEENEKLKDRINELKVEISEKVSLVKVEQQKLLAETSQKDKSAIENLRSTNEALQLEFESFKSKSALEISDLNHQIDNLSENSKQLTEKLSDFENLKDQAVQLSKELEKLKVQDIANQTDNQQLQHNLQEYVLIKQERDDLQQKLNKIMHEVQDVSNRNLFLEQQCENYLILEQSNERLKLANEKLSRQLDETLVSIHHQEGIQANTEFEYLRNIMFQYLTGTINGNNETLVKVIAAVLKFSPQQTQVAIEKEHQRHTLLGQINNLL